MYKMGHEMNLKCRFTAIEFGWASAFGTSIPDLHPALLLDQSALLAAMAKADGLTKGETLLAVANRLLALRVSFAAPLSFHPLLTTTLDSLCEIEEIGEPDFRVPDCGPLEQAKALRNWLATLGYSCLPSSGYTSTRAKEKHAFSNILYTESLTPRALAWFIGATPSLAVDTSAGIRDQAERSALYQTLRICPQFLSDEDRRHLRDLLDSIPIDSLDDAYLYLQISYLLKKESNKAPTLAESAQALTVWAAPSAPSAPATAPTDKFTRWLKSKS